MNTTTQTMVTSEIAYRQQRARSDFRAVNAGRRTRRHVRLWRRDAETH
jgi:hypothetical protein